MLDFCESSRIELGFRNSALSSLFSLWGARPGSNRCLLDSHSSALPIKLLAPRVESPRIEREPPGLQPGVQTDYTRTPNLPGNSRFAPISFERKIAAVLI